MSASAEPTKGKDSLMKMLMNSSIPLQKELGASSDRDLEDNLHETFVSYIQAITGSSQRRIPLVWMEHSYARCVEPGGGGGEGAHSGTGARLLLVRKAPECPGCHEQQEETVDVESVDVEPTPPLLLDDIPPCEKAIEEGELMPEEEDGKTDWEDKLHSLAWNPSQISLLTGALDIVLCARAAFLTAGRAGARRAAARGGAARLLRALLAAPPVRWQPRLVQWLHNALTEHLPSPLLTCYKEVMLTLKSKVPSLVEKMTLGHPLAGRVRGFENGAGGPTIASASGAPPDPGAPVLLLLPSGRDRRDARWAERLRAVGQVQQVHSHQSGWLPQLPVSACLAQLVGSSRAKATALRAEHPQRPLILVGQGAGAAIAVQLAVNVAGVAGVVCLGLPLLTAAGPRGEPEDCILDLPCPILFVIGQNANQCTQQDVESLRLKLKVRSRLVVAGGADDVLRMPRLKRHLEGVTQRMLECAIADEVGSFLTCLSKWDSASDETGRSSPEGDPSGDTEPESPSLTLSIPGRPSSPASSLALPLPPPLSVAPAKRRLMEVAASPKPKKPRISKTLSKTSPLKARGMALYKVNNPPPEGATISMGQILTPPTKSDDDLYDESGNTIKLPTKSVEPASYIQISNNRLTRNIPISSNGKTKDLSSNSGIKVLENIPCKLSKSTASRLVGALSAPSQGSSPLIMPRKTLSHQIQASTSLNPTNIMDIPIIFADDDKTIVSPQHKTPNKSSPASGIKAIIINKQSMANSSGDMKQRIANMTTPSKNIVQVKMSPSGMSPSIGQTIIGTGNSQTFSVKKSNVGGNNPLKYTKVILAKRTPEASSNNSNMTGVNNFKEMHDSTGKRIISSPIIVKGKGAMTTFKVFPGTIFQKGNMTTHPRQLIIKRASSGGGININSMKNNKKKDDGMCENSTSDRAIADAVASITGEQEDLEGL